MALEPMVRFHTSLVCWLSIRASLTPRACGLCPGPRPSRCPQRASHCVRRHTTTGCAWLARIAPRTSPTPWLRVSRHATGQHDPNRVEDAHRDCKAQGSASGVFFCLEKRNQQSSSFFASHLSLKGNQRGGYIPNSGHIVRPPKNHRADQSPARWIVDLNSTPAR